MLGRVIGEYLQDLKLQGSSSDTINAYRSYLRRFELWCGENGLDFKALVPREIKAFRNWLVNEKLSTSAVNMIIYTTKAFYDFLMEEGIVNGNPVIAKRLIIRTKDNPPRFLSDDELNRILPFINKDQHRLVYLTMLSTGLRVGEAAALLPQDVIVKNKAVLLRVRSGKGAKERYVPVTDEQVAKELLQLRDSKSLFDVGPQPTLFGRHKATLIRHAKRIAIKTGVDFTTHRLRHTFATNLLAGGEPLDVVQDIMGHENIATTRRYAKTLPQSFLRLAAKIG